MSKQLLSSEDKKPYEKPAVIHRQIMETVAGACSDADPTNGKVGDGSDMCTNPMS
ncbi:MAG TPA: hypothetical protein VLL52_11165 [Anaerolineae bacterium]|nr:hypothetical protein [Anaerolineae bacterium]